MTTFDEREQAFEAKFARDEEMQFKAQARCNKMLGLWAAEKMGKSGVAAETYANALVTASVEDADHEDVVRKVTADLQGHVTSDEIRQKRAALLPAAQQQILSEAS
ncbi:DUF1476 domain-containing protein [Parasedimentitalea psychrophila]|uniref:DUF1476 domain-containing protein n=1 Tax=Parasedimentitalea psychrophila TaxID=2997337 RepID=A0A9Y2P5P0_9RHOB|nr:DUF1476 domain-containing protein [Parasedimentitalea psychrophila]WIY24168.1 DUF1476 domain-containing protein [Parasedimentitalea psychrophila]